MGIVATALSDVLLCLLFWCVCLRVHVCGCVCASAHVCARMCMCIEIIYRLLFSTIRYLINFTVIASDLLSPAHSVVITLPSLPGRHVLENYFYFQFFQHNVTDDSSIFEIGYIIGSIPENENANWTVAEINISSLNITMLELPKARSLSQIQRWNGRIDAVTGYRTYAQYACPQESGCTKCHFRQYSLSSAGEAPYLSSSTPIEHEDYAFVGHDKLDISRWKTDDNNTALAFSSIDGCDGTVLELLRIDSSKSIVLRSLTMHSSVIIHEPMLTVDASGERIYILGMCNWPISISIFNATTFQVSLMHTHKSNMHVFTTCTHTLRVTKMF